MPQTDCLEKEILYGVFTITEPLSFFTHTHTHTGVGSGGGGGKRWYVPPLFRLWKEHIRHTYVCVCVLHLLFGTLLYRPIRCSNQGARCSSVVRVFAHGAMGRRIDPSWWTHSALSRSSQCSTTGVSCLCDGAYNLFLLLIGKSSPCGASGFPLLLSEWSFIKCPTPINRK